ncbi:MAG: hypothetical protein C0404_02070 [Verrucomicrobia bacterium]|nr:hypothetical protein [Verrucomicrobiota bacterium]
MKRTLYSAASLIVLLAVGAQAETPIVVSQPVHEQDTLREMRCRARLRAAWDFGIADKPAAEARRGGVLLPEP